MSGAEGLSALARFSAMTRSRPCCTRMPAAAMADPESPSAPDIYRRKIAVFEPVGAEAEPVGRVVRDTSPFRVIFSC
jgi:flagellar basal-body rod protein FlgC